MRCKTAIVAVLTLATFVSGCVTTKTVYVDYRFGISTVADTVAENVTLYLPFPCSNNKPVEELFQKLVEDYERYRREAHPDVSLEIVETSHGPMLKIFAPTVGQDGFGLTARWASDVAKGSQDPQELYALSPLLDGKDSVHPRTYLYVDYEDSEPLEFSLSYSVKDRTRQLILPPQHPRGNDYHAFVGWDRLPSSDEKRTVTLETKGWLELPVAEVTYATE